MIFFVSLFAVVGGIALAATPPPPGCTEVLRYESMLYRNIHRIPLESGSETNYALITLVPTGQRTGAVNADVGFLIDTSGSMVGEDGTGINRRDRVVAAALQGVRQLREGDSVSISAFESDPSRVLGTTSMSDLRTIESGFRSVPYPDGNTYLARGLDLLLGEMQRTLQAGRAAHAVVCTDGGASDADECPEQAERLLAAGIETTFIGIGTDWNEILLGNLARLANGRLHYIDANNAADTERIFREVFERVTNASFTDVRMSIRPLRGVSILSLHEVRPQVRGLSLLSHTPRAPAGATPLTEYGARLGTLPIQSSRYLMQFRSPARNEPGRFVVASVTVSYSTARGVRQQIDFNLEVTYSARASSPINAHVAHYFDDVNVYETNRELQLAAQQGDASRVAQLTRLIQAAVTHLPPARRNELTRLAGGVATSIANGGQTDRRTLLSLGEAIANPESNPGTPTGQP